MDDRFRPGPGLLSHAVYHELRCARWLALILSDESAGEFPWPLNFSSKPTSGQHDAMPLKHPSRLKRLKIDLEAS